MAPRNWRPSAFAAVAAVAAAYRASQPAPRPDAVHSTGSATTARRASSRRRASRSLDSSTTVPGDGPISVLAAAPTRTPLPPDHRRSGADSSPPIVRTRSSLTQTPPFGRVDRKNRAPARAVAPTPRAFAGRDTGPSVRSGTASPARGRRRMAARVVLRAGGGGGGKTSLPRGGGPPTPALDDFYGDADDPRQDPPLPRR